MRIDRMKYISTLPKKDDKYQCPNCKEYFAAEDFDIDHKVPLRLGGTDTDANRQALCKKCNRIKGAAIDANIIDTSYFSD